MSCNLRYEVGPETPFSQLSLAPTPVLFYASELVGSTSVFISKCKSCNQPHTILKNITQNMSVTMLRVSPLLLFVLGLLSYNYLLNKRNELVFL